jgi:hypothetical protein
MASTPKAFHNYQEAEVLRKYAALSKNYIAELGAAYGYSAVELLRGSPPTCHVYSIDNFRGDPVYDLHILPEECEATVKREMPDDYHRWTLLQMPTVETVKYIIEPIDFLFIDADHSYNAVCNDFYAWYPIVKVGGHIAFHDSTSIADECVQGPRQFVKELCNYAWEPFIDPYDGERLVTKPNPQPFTPTVKLVDTIWTISVFCKTQGL